VRLRNFDLLQDEFEIRFDISYHGRALPVNAAMLTATEHILGRLRGA
jgi:hypothetical protein